MPLVAESAGGPTVFPVLTLIGLVGPPMHCYTSAEVIRSGGTDI